MISTLTFQEIDLCGLLYSCTELILKTTLKSSILILRDNFSETYLNSVFETYGRGRNHYLNTINQKWSRSVENTSRNT